MTRAKFVPYRLSYYVCIEVMETETHAAPTVAHEGLWGPTIILNWRGASKGELVRRTTLEDEIRAIRTLA